MSRDPEQDFFADGMTEDIITELSRMPWFFVIARNTTFTYKGRSVDVKEVARELGVAYVLEGSVRKGGNRLRITAQLIDGATGKHVWAERYDREIVDLFDIQDEVTAAIVGAAAPEFMSFEARRARRKDASQLDAWESLMRGRSHLWKLGRDDTARARELFHQAMERDPNGEFGAADLALVHLWGFYYGWSGDQQESLRQMDEYARKGVAADETEPWALAILSWATIFSRKWDDALAPVEKAVRFAPSFAPAVGIRGTIRGLLGDIDGCLEDAATADRLSPRDPLAVFWLIGEFWAHHSRENYEAALVPARKGVALAPDNPSFRRQMTSALAWLGRMDEAREALREYLRIEPDHTCADVAMVPCNNPEIVDRFVEGLRRAGLPD